MPNLHTVQENAARNLRCKVAVLSDVVESLNGRAVAASMNGDTLALAAYQEAIDAVRALIDEHDTDADRIVTHLPIPRLIADR